MDTNSSTGRQLTAEEVAIIVTALEEHALAYSNPDDRDDLMRDYTVTLDLIEAIADADAVTVAEGCEEALVAFVRPLRAAVFAAWTAGRAAALANNPPRYPRRDAYGDPGLQALYRHGFWWGRQERLQAKYGDPPSG